MIELGREFLTERNVPVVRCIVCLYSILEEDAIVKTECLHFFHKVLIAHATDKLSNIGRV